MLIDEATGQELYRIDTPRRFVGSVTRVFRCDPKTPPTSNLMPRLHWDANEPHKTHDLDERKHVAKAKLDRHGDGEEGDNEVVPTVDKAPEEDSPLVENEIARLYWKWFASARIVFEGKIRRRAEFMPVKGKLRG